MDYIMENSSSESVLSLGLDGLSILESNRLLKVQKDILEVVITGNDYQYALEQLCIAAEGILDNSLASIMLFDEEKKYLNVRAAPNIPQNAIDKLNKLQPSDNAGSCGTAVFKEEPQFVYDTFSDFRWKDLREFAEEFNIHACWSMPIVNNSNEVIGSFALSSFEKRLPDFYQETLLQTAACLSSLILQKEIDEAKLYYAAHYDNLTNLPNRMHFQDRLEHAITQAERSDSGLAVFFIDLDNFKQINDVFGHEEGDKVLKAVALNMQHGLRKEDSLARLGGDEFVLLVERCSDINELELIANKLLHSFSKKLRVDSNQYSVTASIGICCLIEKNCCARELIMNADKAMYLAKQLGKNKFCFY